MERMSRTKTVVSACSFLRCIRVFVLRNRSDQIASPPSIWIT